MTRKKDSQQRSSIKKEKKKAKIVQKKKKQQIEEKQIEESLRVIYEVNENENVPLNKLESVKSYRWFWVLGFSFLFIILLSFISWMGFLYFKDFNGFSGNGMAISIEGPSEISLGQETTYFINYRNLLHEPLKQVSLRVNFPNDFIITKTSLPVKQKALVWNLGDISSEGRGSIKISGRFIGALGSLSAIQVISTYQPSSYSSQFEAMTVRKISYSNTVIDGWLEMPKKTIPGDDIKIKYHLKNKNLDDLHNLEIRFLLPNGFSASNTQSGVDQSDKLIKMPLAELAGNSSSTVSISGKFLSGYGGLARVIAKIGTVSNNGTFMPMQIAEGNLSVLAGDLSLKLIINGENSTEQNINYGQELQGVIGYENTADESLKDVSFILSVEAFDFKTGKVLELEQVLDKKEFNKLNANIKDDKIIWNTESDPSLAEIPPTVNDVIKFKIPIIKLADSRFQNLALKIKAIAQIKKIGDTEMNREISTTETIIKLKSDVDFSSIIKYFSEEGTPLGSGPLPPKIGHETQYRVFWKIKKNVHKLKNINITAKLPANVRFIRVATSTIGELSYNNVSQEVTWKLNLLPEKVNQAEMQFQLGISPLPTDDGKFITLIKETVFKADDENIQDSFLQIIKKQTSDLENDKKASGKGVVAK